MLSYYIYNIKIFFAHVTIRRLLVNKILDMKYDTTYDMIG